MSWPKTTHDGLPVAQERPLGACVVVYRDGARGREFLILHRAHDGPGYEGDWAWTPPAGCRFPDEAILDCAARELKEETGLILPINAAARDVGDFAVFVADAGADAIVTLNEEHDRFEWVSAAEAKRRCRPAVVAAEIDAALAFIESAS